MKKILSVLATIFMFGCISSTYNVSISNELPDYSSEYKSIAFLYINNSSGGGVRATGFAYDKDLILTAGHFCVAALEIQVFDTHENSVNMEYYDKNMKIRNQEGLVVEKLGTIDDLCVLRKDGHGLVPLNILKDYSKLKIRDNVTAIGLPHGIAFGEFNGRIMDTGLTGRRSAKQIENLLVLSIPGASGMSGSPIILDETHEVIGVFILGVTSGFDHLIFAVPSHRVLELVKGL